MWYVVDLKTGAVVAMDPRREVAEDWAIAWGLSVLSETEYLARLQLP